MLNRFIIVILITLLGSCASFKPYNQNQQDQSSVEGKVVSSTFLLGGLSVRPEQWPETLEVLQKQIKVSSGKSTVILLGNDGPKHHISDSITEEAVSPQEEFFQKQLTSLNDLGVNTYLTAGLGEWAFGGRKGYERVLNMESYAALFLANKANNFLPSSGCPGPVEVNISEDLVAIFINTQWWLHEWSKPGEGSSCTSISRGDFIVHLEDAIKRNSNKQILVVGSHPIFSNGKRAGYFPVSTHLFPPVLGSIYAGYRRSIGNLQDFASPKYKLLRQALQDVFQNHPNLIYASGHEQSLQYHKVGNIHQVISGAATNQSPVVHGKTAQYAHGAKGFAKLSHYDNGDAWIEFWTVGNNSEPSFKQRLFKHKAKNIVPAEIAKVESNVSFTGKNGTGVGDATLTRNKKGPGLLGHNYRKEWGAELTVPRFDFEKEHGGLKIVQRGGGMQTRSLRMEDPEGKQYVLRSIEKFPEAAVPAVFRGTIVGDLVKDQLSASHPYAAFAVPIMAGAVGVYHTNPTLVYLGDDPHLGPYREDFKNGLYLYEERPAKNRDDVASFGNSTKIVNTFDVLKKTQQDGKHYVDQLQVVRSRLFDIVIGDWDRHDDQWRWGSYKDSVGQTYYQPIPRDRDQAFFFGDGQLIRFASHKWGNPKTQGFHDDIRDVTGLEFNARHFDRSFMTEPSLEQWLTIANDIQERLSDQVISEAINQLPKPIYDINGEIIISKLKKRRDNLQQYAREHYSFLAKGVDVVGTKKRELFEVNRTSDESVEVVMFSVNKKLEKKKILYKRVFNASETSEIRLYALGGDDVIEINGNTRKGIRIRVIGGKGHDRIIDNISTKGPKKVLFYDKMKNSEISGTGIKDKTSDESDINNYDRKSFQYNKLFPLAKISANPDDGFIFGGGATLTTHGFRKAPFAAQHHWAFDFAPQTAAFNLVYKGLFSQVLGQWDYGLELDIHQPGFSDFFYGLGNKTASDEDARKDDKQFYLARYSQYTLKNDIIRKLGSGQQLLKIGAYYNSINVTSSANDAEPGRFIVVYPNQVGRGPNDEQPLLDIRRHYVGANIGYTLDNRDHKFIPTRGFNINVEGKAVKQLSDEENTYQQLAIDASTYLSTAGRFKTTLAVRVGTQLNFGTFEFYQSARLGGTTNHRGYRKFRFSGDQSFYQNTELRIKLFNFKTSILPGAFGLIAFHDIGRVWSDQPDEVLFDNGLDSWHRGYGGGFWISPLGQVAISAEMAKSNDEKNSLFFLRFGFMF